MKLSTCVSAGQSICTNLYWWSGRRGRGIDSVSDSRTEPHSGKPKPRSQSPNAISGSIGSSSLSILTHAASGVNIFAKGTRSAPSPAALAAPKASMTMRCSMVSREEEQGMAIALAPERPAAIVRQVPRRTWPCMRDGGRKGRRPPQACPLRPIARMRRGGVAGLGLTKARSTGGLGESLLHCHVARSDARVRLGGLSGAGQLRNACASTRAGAAQKRGVEHGASRRAQWIWLPSAPGRGYAALRAYADALDADVIAFQEVESAAAAARVFAPERYQIVMETRAGGSGRLECRGLAGHYLNRQATDFAVRKGLRVERLPDVSALHLGDENLRSGVDIRVHGEGGRPLRLMSVHLKSGCAAGETAEPCPTLLRKRAFWRSGSMRAPRSRSASRCSAILTADCPP